MRLHPVEVTSLQPEIFRMFEEQPPLLTAGDKEHCNTMTIGWCQLGTLWHLPVCTVYVRPERYTYQFMEEQDYFTVSVLPESEKQPLRICGTKSGRDMDKVKECGFTVKTAACGAPYFEEAELVIVCRKRYVQDFDPAAIPADVKEKQYPNQDYHTMYIGEIVEVLSK